LIISTVIMITNSKHPRHLRRAHRVYGFSLVELMVGVTIGLFLVGVASALFVATRQSFVIQDNVSHFQESSRAAIEDVTRELRKAGSLGCYQWKASARPMRTATLPLSAAATFPLPMALSGNINNLVVNGGTNGSLVLPGGSGISLSAANDYVSLLYGQPVATLSLPGGAFGVSTDVYAAYPLNTSINVLAGQPFMIADCDTAILFRADDAGPTSALLHHVIGGGNNILPSDIPTADTTFGGNNYRSGAIVMSLEMPTFFVGTDGSGVSSLYRWDTSNGGGVQPMIPNVEQMRVLYGVDTSHVAGHLEQVNNRVDAATVQASSWWGNVMSVEVHLVLRSDEEGGAGTVSTGYTWSSSDHRFVPGVAPTDKYLRRVYVASATIRSRAPIM
jgi:type IV pilus assembly protein PilW